ASLGPEFVIDIKRPRDRTEMNHNEKFKTLRKSITHYLMQTGLEAGISDETKTLPEISPNTAFPPNKTAQKAGAANSLALDRYVEFSKLSKIYPTPKGPLTVVENFDLKIRKGEFIS